MMVAALPPSGSFQALLQTSVHGEEDEAIIVVGSSGTVGSRVSSGQESTIKAGKWHTVTISVCSYSHTVTTYVDGMLACTVQPDDIARDGRYALQGGAVCVGGSSRKAEELELNLRTVTVTSRALSAVEITDQNMTTKREDQGNDDNQLFMLVLEALTSRYPDSEPDVSMISFIVAEAQGSTIDERFMSAMGMLG